MHNIQQVLSYSINICSIKRNKVRSVSQTYCSAEFVFKQAFGALEKAREGPDVAQYTLWEMLI